MSDKPKKKKGTDIITISRAGSKNIKVTGKRKEEERLIRQLLDFEKKWVGYRKEDDD